MTVVSINATQNETLLEVMELRSIPVQSHCRDGFCGTCRTRLIKGEVDYFIEPLAYIDDDEVLPCCCKTHSTVQISTN